MDRIVADAAPAVIGDQPRPKGRGRLTTSRLGIDFLTRFVARQPLGALGAGIVLLFLTAAVLGDTITPHDPQAINLRERLQGPSSTYWLGTDAVGHDVFSRLILGARLSLVIGLGAVFLSTTAGLLIGVTSAYFGGKFDMLVQRMIDAWIAMPDLIILITLLGVIQRMENVNIVVAMLVALAFTRTAPASRVIRAVTLEVRSRPFIEAAESAGAAHFRIMLRHVLPNILPLIIVTATVALPATILAEASLSFLGFGPAGEPSWGQMLSTEGRDFFRRQPGLAIWPGVCIAVTVFGFNMFGDALRDVLDPRLRGSR